MLFDNVFKEFKKYTLIDRERCLQIWEHAQKAAHLPGYFAECGVYRGGSAMLMIEASSKRKTIHLFDTFRGIPEEQREEGDHVSGRFSASVDMVRKNLIQYRSKCEFHEGLVPGTLHEVSHIAFCLVHLDMDIYAPTIAALKFFWRRMVPGGVILLDDYRALKGINKAIKEFEAYVGQKCIQTANVQCSFTNKI